MASCAFLSNKPLLKKYFVQIIYIYVGQKIDLWVTSSSLCGEDYSLIWISRFQYSQFFSYYVLFCLDSETWKLLLLFWEGRERMWWNAELGLVPQRTGFSLYLILQLLENNKLSRLLWSPSKICFLVCTVAAAAAFQKAATSMGLDESKMS